MSDIAPVSVEFLLIGKTGGGKSSVGNSILGREEFESGTSTTSVTQQIRCGWRIYDNNILKVVDGPGLADTDLSDLEDTERTCSFIGQALGLCPTGIHVFILVLKYGDRFTKEDQGVVESLKKILGQDFLKSYTIIVMTRGDQFVSDMKHEKQPLDFIKWCSQQKGAIVNLLAECSFRILLFNNRAEHGEMESQLKKLFTMAEQVKQANGGKRYCNEHFERCGKDRQKLVIELKAPELNVEFQEKICLTLERIGNLHETSTQEDIQAIESDITSLLERIKEEDKDTGVLNDLLKKVLELQNTATTFKESKDRKRALKQLERQRKTIASAAKKRFALLATTFFELVARGVLLGATTIAAVFSVGTAVPVALGANVAGQVAITGVSIAAREKILQHFKEPKDDPKEDKK